MLKSMLLSWNFNRIVRMALAVFAAYQAWQMSDVALGVMAALLGFMALTNTGCCGGGSCDLPRR